ncbi:hypothetical protein RHRU231_800119 [Rhodococcus ruber]|uniref:Uncharacterized protein n=1 Tax=Rhodococcus ruber TaxID=1830 RepID=A0A098BSJ6_9NOCA|nr:hypothetical protein RHRU231_800119 [Rhodococcus ruber]
MAHRTRHRSGSRVPDETEPDSVAGFLPLTDVHGGPLGTDRRGEGIRSGVQVHLRDDQLRRVRYGLRVDLSATYDADVAVPGERQGLRHPVGHLGARVRPGRVASDDDVAPARQRPEARRQRLPRQPAHDHRLSPRRGPEVRHVLGDVPRDRTVAADAPGAVLRPDQDDVPRRRHTATGALMGGWCR